MAGCLVLICFIWLTICALVSLLFKVLLLVCSDNASIICTSTIHMCLTEVCSIVTFN
jgi:hypothetical protein